MKYYFKAHEKKEILKGRTVVSLLDFFDLNYCYLTRIISGSTSCSLKTAKQITKAINQNAKVEDFFVERG